MVCGDWTQIHHINEGGMDRNEWAVIPLCFLHHLGTPAMSKDRFRAEHGEEWPLFFQSCNEVIPKLIPKYQAEIVHKIDAYAKGKGSSHLFMEAYEKGRVGVEV